MLKYFSIPVVPVFGLFFSFIPFEGKLFAQESQEVQASSPQAVKAALTREDVQAATLALQKATGYLKIVHAAANVDERIGFLTKDEKYLYSFGYHWIYGSALAIAKVSADKKHEYGIFIRVDRPKLPTLIGDMGNPTLKQILDLIEDVKDEVLYQKHYDVTEMKYGFAKHPRPFHFQPESEMKWNLDYRDR